MSTVYVVLQVEANAIIKGKEIGSIKTGKGKKFFIICRCYDYIV